MIITFLEFNLIVKLFKFTILHIKLYYYNENTNDFLGYVMIQDQLFAKLVQESTRDSVRLLPDLHQPLVNKLASALGLSCIGWIFTDLVTEDASKGTVRHFRHIDSHFLSAQECIMAGYFQSLHANPCRFSSDGQFGSKFVTVCVTGFKKIILICIFPFFIISFICNVH